MKVYIVIDLLKNKYVGCQNKIIMEPVDSILEAFYHETYEAAENRAICLTTSWQSIFKIETIYIHKK